MRERLPGSALRRLLCATLLVAGAAPIAVHAECRAESPAHRVALLELYTSEGCSSCPPADRFVSGLRDQGFGRDRVAPLALHVDYWNDLGWPDPFSHAAFASRQRRHASLLRLNTIYTPQLVLSGGNLLNWHRGEFSATLARINAEPAQAVITVVTKHAGADALHLDVSAKLKTPADGAELYTAVYERHITRDIHGGENRGRRLQHDFVTRLLMGPVRADAQGAIGIRGPVTLEPDWKRKDLGIVAFVQNRDSGAVLQALDLPLCPDKN